MARKKSFVLYDNWGSMLCMMGDEDVGKLIKAMVRYAFSGRDTRIDNDDIQFAFDGMKEQIDSDSQKYQEKVKRIEEARSQRTKTEQKSEQETKQKSTMISEQKSKGVNVNEDVSVDVFVDKKDIKENIVGKPDTHSAEISLIVDYLNEKAGTRYKHTSKTTQAAIRARLKDGFSVEDFKTVIDVKTKKWLNDPKMRDYLRPETLFAASHFESYLNEVGRELPKAEKYPGLSERMAKDTEATLQKPRDDDDSELY